MIGGERDRVARKTNGQTGYGLVVCHISKATADGYRALVCGAIQEDDIFSVSLVIDSGSIVGDTADGTLYIEVINLVLKDEAF